MSQPSRTAKRAAAQRRREREIARQSNRTVIGKKAGRRQEHLWAACVIRLSESYIARAAAGETSLILPPPGWRGSLVGWSLNHPAPLRPGWALRTQAHRLVWMRFTAWERKRGTC